MMSKSGFETTPRFLGNTCVMGYFTARAVVESGEKCREGREDTEERKAWCSTGALATSRTPWSKLKSVDIR